MKKDFDVWNKVKKEVDDKNISKSLYFYEREVWWCSLGINIGVEINGKGENFERPVLIIKKFNGDMIWIVSLTSKQKNGKHYIKIEHELGPSWASLTQIKTISTKRLLRKIGMAHQRDFNFVRNRLLDHLKIETPASDVTPCGGISEAEATNKISIDEGL